MSEAKWSGMESDGAEIAWNRWILSLDVIRPGTDRSFDTFVAGYSAGRVSRDGLRKALADLFAVVNGECPSLLNEDSGGASYLYLQIKEALEADGGSK